MSARSSRTRTAGVQFEKPKSDIYTVMLALSLVAVLLGILCLYLEMKIYDFDIKADSVRGDLQEAAAPVVRFDGLAWASPATGRGLEALAVHDTRGFGASA